MAEALISAVLQQLTTIIGQEAEQEIRLVVGVEEDVRKLTSKFQAIQDVLVDAENRQLKEPPVRRWLDKLRDVAYDMEDVLDEWGTSILKLQLEGVHENSSGTGKKVCSFFTSPCICFGKLALRHDIARKIKDINKNLNDIVEEQKFYKFSETTKASATINGQDRSTTSFIDMSEVRGRDEEKNTLEKMLLSEGTEGGKGLNIFSLVGMGGIGKTTLAQFAYNHESVVSYFDKRIWVCVSETFDQIRIAKAIIESLTDGASNLIELENLLCRISEIVATKRILLVLDDVWTEEEDKLKPFLLCFSKGLCGSKILVTTRKDSVSRVIGPNDTSTICVKELSDDECWLLFSRIAFSMRSIGERQKLEKIGRKIVTKCKGLPFAAKTLGSLLRFKETKGEWQSILESEMWELEFDKGPLPPLLLSYNDLPYMVKRCFLYCAVFPKDYTIDKDDLIRLWMAQGYLGLGRDQELEIIGNEYFNILATRSFFQEFEKPFGQLTCKMHDIVHDFAQYVCQNECFTIHSNDDDRRAQLSYEKAHHGMVVIQGKDSFPFSYIRSKTLRTLLVEINNCSYYIPIDEILNQLTRLRVFKWVDDPNTWNKEMESTLTIPNEIKKLIHLRYFGVSSNRLSELPETLCELHNLQTLDVTSCHWLKELPRGLGKLINLRHLINSLTSQLSYMPKGIERLTRLQTLSEFVVSDSHHNEETSTLASLKYLKHLQGGLKIKWLGNVKDLSVVNEAQLHNLTKLAHLDLEFGRMESTSTAEDDELLLEALQLPPDLQRLSMAKYGGKFMPQIWVSSLTHLRELELTICRKLEFLPHLGKLSSLESIELRGMWRVRNVGKEFLGIESGIDASSTSSSSSTTLFPKLTYLKFSNLPEWEVWDYGITMKKGEKEDIKIMPCLDSLAIRGCSKLKVLPDHLFQNTSLKELKIRDCPLLCSYLKERGLDWAQNFHIPQISYRDPWRSYKSVIDEKEHKFDFIEV